MRCAVETLQHPNCRINPVLLLSKVLDILHLYATSINFNVFMLNTKSILR